MPKRKPSKRRESGTGYITTTQAGKSKAHYPKAGGGYYTKVCTDQASAQRWLAGLASQEQQHIQLADGKQALDTWITTWLDGCANDPDSPLKLKTIADYTYKLGYVSTLIGHMALDAITIDVIDDAMRIIRRRLAATTTAQIRNLLDQLFTEAVRRRYILYSPAVKQKRKASRGRQKIVKRLTFEQAAQLLDTTTDPRLHTMLWLMLCLPLRLGEILGLRRSDLDLQNATLTINQTAVDIRGKPTLSTPKTETSVRTLPIPHAVVPLIETQLTENIRRAKTFVRWQEHTLVFPSAAGTPQNQSRFLKALKAAYQDAGLDRTMGSHHLRHTSSAFYTAIDAPEVVRAALAGHSQGITNYYGEADITTLRRWVEQVHRKLAGEIEELKQTGT